MADPLAPARWYPNQPPRLAGESDEARTDRILAGGVYDHHRNRQCSIGWHGECSDRGNSGDCECPHHEQVRLGPVLVFEWNAAHPTGTRVVLPLAPDEPPTTTSGPALVVERDGLKLPMVPLEGFPHPVELAWVAASVVNLLPRPWSLTAGQCRRYCRALVDVEHLLGAHLSSMRSSYRHRMIARRSRG